MTDLQAHQRQRFLDAHARAKAKSPAPHQSPRPVVLLFSDDSTLFFALRMRDILRATRPDQPIQMAWVSDENALSYRQMSQLLPEGPDRVLRNKQFEALLASPDLAAVLTSRVYSPLGDMLKNNLTKLAANRPCVISFLGGLDFTPQHGYFRRRNTDGIFLFPKSELDVYAAQSQNWDIMWQSVEFGHPSFLRPHSLSPEALAHRRDIYFFTQALSPSTRRGRIHMLRAMAAIARANPDHRVWIKLRHLPGENKNHLHKELHDYPALLKELPEAPENLRLTACTMDEALADAALGITCTSTAAIDVVRSGIPCMVHLDYVDNYMDPLMPPMKALFENSGLITSLEDMLHLRSTPARPEWVDNMFCPDDLGQRVFDLIDRFKARPFQIQP